MSVCVGTLRIVFDYKYRYERNNKSEKNILIKLNRTNGRGGRGIQRQRKHSS